MSSSNLIPGASQSIGESVYSGLPGRTNGPADTYRHILWGAELTRRYGETIARFVLLQDSDDLIV